MGSIADVSELGVDSGLKYNSTTKTMSVPTGYVAIGKASATGARLDLNIPVSTTLAAARIRMTDMAHGMTTILPTDCFAEIGIGYHATDFSEGGLQITAIGAAGGCATSSEPYVVRAYHGVTDPADADAVVKFVTGKKNGTGTQAIAAAETALALYNTTTQLLRVDGSGNVNIGSTSGESKLNIYATNNNTPHYTNLKMLGMAHGMTAIAPTDVFGVLSSRNSNDFAEGGLSLIGISVPICSSALVPLQLRGIHGIADPADSAAAIELKASKKSGTVDQALAAAETVLSVLNDSTEVLRILGDGKVGIGDPTTISNLLTIKYTGEVNAIRLTDDTDYWELGTNGSSQGHFSIKYNGTTRVDIVEGGLNIPAAHNIMIGSTTSGASSQLEIAKVGVATTAAELTISTYTNGDADTGGSKISLKTSQGTSLGTLTETNTGDVLGIIDSYGVNSSSTSANATRILMAQSGAAGAAYVAGTINMQVATNAAAPASICTVDIDGVKPTNGKHIYGPYKTSAGGAGFTGTGNYVSFTIVEGIITAAVEAP